MASAVAELFDRRLAVGAGSRCPMLSDRATFKIGYLACREAT
jgi:hypothetical protein